MIVHSKRIKSLLDLLDCFVLEKHAGEVFVNDEDYAATQDVMVAQEAMNVRPSLPIEISLQVSLHFILQGALECASAESCSCRFGFLSFAKDQFDILKGLQAILVVRFASDIFQRHGVVAKRIFNLAN